MEYTEHNGVIYVSGLLRVISTPKGYAILKRKSMQGNEYEPMKNQIYGTRGQALDACEEIMRGRKCCTQ